ncbi:MAG: Gldg family protein [Alphaproteobacteria bacterium]|nr:Gldg family protein [Alphaproteobacteria bacterium]MDD9920222.1 Gldg family protein [Alphaproteobacteria bacterium]
MMQMIRRYFAVYAHELQQLHTQANTYIFLTFAWMAMALCTFYLGGFFSRGEADLNAFFAFQPWIYLFLMPALAMGIWSEEWRRGTAERLLTLPVHPILFTLAKFKALQTVFVFALLGTFPMVVTVFWLGEPAWGPIITGYIGCLCVGSAMLAVALAASQLSRSQAGGFVLGLLFLFILVASGWGVLTRLLEGFLPPVFIDALIQFSVLDRFRNFNEGVLDVRDILFFVSLTFGFLLLTHVFLIFRRSFKIGSILVTTAIVVVIAVNVLAESLLWRWDATPSQVHTLDPQTIKFIKELDQDVNVKFYFSADNNEVPVPVQQFARRVQDKLRDMRRFNPAQFQVEFLVPEVSTRVESQAQEHGMQEIALPSGEGYYFGLAVNTSDRGSRLPVMTPGRQGFLEFDIMSALSDVMKTRTQKVGILTELNLGREETRPRFVQDLLDAYDLTILKPGEPEFSDDIDLIIVFMTPFFDQENLYALDQYLVSGGKVLLVLDPYLRTAPSTEFQAPDRNADAWGFDHPADLLRHWGVEYDHSQVVGDVAAAMPVQLPGIGMTQYPLWLALEPNEINHDMPFTANVDRMLLAESGFFTVTEIARGLHYEPILTSSSSAQTVSRTLFTNNEPHLVAGKLGGEKKRRDLAFMLSGKFNSAFPEMSSAAKLYYEDYAENPDQIVYPEHKMQGAKDGALVVLGDLDFVADDYAMITERVAGEVVQQPANDNLVFFYNAIQYLLGDRVLLPIRGKAQERRPFVKVEEMMQVVSHKYQKVEQELVAELFHVANRLRELHERAEKRQVIEGAIQKEIKAFQKRELDVKKRLRQVRRTLRKDIDALERTLAVLNMAVMPVLIWIYALLFFYRRRQRAKNGA